MDSSTPFIQVINFFFVTMSSLWSLILSSWVFSISVLIILVNWVISLVNGSRQDS